VLYSLSLKNAAETPGAIIKLSDILRYVIYESAAGEVPLASEITLLHNYIDLQRYRIDASTRITFNMDIQDPNVSIVSMILLPLVENSFKHGVKGDIENTFIDISLHAARGVINFSIANNKSNVEPTEKTSGGIGLKNIEERLSLIYGNRYELTVDHTPKTFTVELTINTTP
jgi:LytS/YehU family sensor histidine kinase